MMAAQLSLGVLSAIVATFLVWTMVEFARHQRRVPVLRHRIHVNGTRGKSSVTRLIGAGLRAGGVNVVTKVTGTFPRLITMDGRDVVVHRRAAATILEQLDIIRFCTEQRVEAVVIECMALEPAFQRITEEQMVHATLSVMTNVRLDHTDVMGPTLRDVGRSMANTIPRDGRVLTSATENVDLVCELARERGAAVDVIDPGTVTQAESARFPYIEHRENIALALAVCAELGVARDRALDGMVAARPDAGVLTRSTIHRDEISATLYNAFAANDPDSSLMIWRMLGREGHLRGQAFVLLNSRADRKERSEQLATLIGRELQHEVDAVFVMGRPTDAV
ncbi:MAG: poly-gamma-glutamate synthase PgsB, partial [Pseudomonadota bacterium]